MSGSTANDGAGLSRRAFAGLGAAAGVTAAMTVLPAVPAVAGPTRTTLLPLRAPRPRALAAPDAGLTYAQLDGFAFVNDSIGTPGEERIYQDNTGVQPVTANTRMSAALPIPTGSTIYQLNVAYQGGPIMEIWKRSLTTPVPFAPAFQKAAPTTGG